MALSASCWSKREFAILEGGGSWFLGWGYASSIWFSMISSLWFIEAAASNSAYEVWKLSGDSGSSSWVSDSGACESYWGGNI